MNLQLHAMAHDSHYEVSVTSECLHQVEKNAEYFAEKLNSGLVVYGVNTGFGGSADIRCADTTWLQKSLLRFLNAGKYLNVK